MTVERDGTAAGPLANDALGGNGGGFTAED
jgi:hypothetical protein